MPVYVYKNLQTGETFEVQQSIRDAALTTHPESGAPVRRVVQPVGIAFKGSGFYVTDSRKSGSASMPAKSENKTEAKPESKTENKPEAKAEAKTSSSSKKD